ncbi:MAG: preprotein translocase subunit SecY, partial [Sphingomonadales bacterium]
MVSAAEQLAKNMSFSSFGKAKELRQRIFFALGSLIIYRFATYVPLPGIDPSILRDIFTQLQQQGGVINMFNAFSGGALSRMSIIALNIMPYISASIIMTLLTSMSPSLATLKKEGERGRKKINQYTRYGTVLLTVLQGYALAVGLETMTGSGGLSAVVDPGMFFRITTVITLVGGTMFLMWLGEQITARGIGNGISLII